MRDISLHLSDIIENSCAAGATEVRVSVSFNSRTGMLDSDVRDNGRGMDAETVLKVTDPFYTSRTTRKVGLGLPLLKANAELTGGTFSLESVLGGGTCVRACFDMNSVDAKPLGDIAETMLAAITGRKGIRFVLSFEMDGNGFVFDTDEVKAILGGEAEIGSPEVYAYLKDYLETNVHETLLDTLL